MNKTILNLLRIVAIWTLIPILVYAKSISVPMRYDVKTNGYYVDLRLDSGDFKPFLVDTGSSELVTLAQNTVISYRSYLKSMLYPLFYGDMYGYAIQHEGNVTLDNKNHTQLKNFPYLVWIKGQNIHSVLGLGQQSLAPIKEKVIFLDAITTEQGIPKIFSVLENASKKAGLLYFGDIPDTYKKRPVVQIPFFGSQYTVDLLGIYDENDNNLIDLQDTNAIFDSGTSAEIVLRTTEHKQLINYLQKQVPAIKNIPDNFWSGNICILQSYLEHEKINLKKFPTLILKIKAKNSQIVSIPFHPKEYITQDYCQNYQDEYVKFIFTDVLKKYVANNKSVTIPIILGGPIFKKFLVSFKFEPERLIELRAPQ